MREQITFQEVDPQSLTEEQQVLWAELLSAKAAFKASLQELAPAGKSIQFVEKYGKLKIAVATKAAPKAPARTLADMIAAAEADGHAH